MRQVQGKYMPYETDMRGKRQVGRVQGSYKWYKAGTKGMMQVQGV